MAVFYYTKGGKMAQIIKHESETKRYLLDNKISLKAKGLLCILLSLPDDWDYSINGLVEICKESKTAVTSALGELRKYGYIRLERTRNDDGTFEYVYTAFEQPINGGNLHK